MADPQQPVLATLSSLGVEFGVLEHAAADSPNAHAAALDADAGAVTQTWLLKDKKDRVYMVTALMGTKLDAKALSARLGLGKALLQELTHQEVLEILPGQPPCLSPLSLIQASASKIVLLLDQRLKAQVAIFVPSLLNTCSIRLSPAALDSFIASIHRSSEYVDLEAAPKITKDQPPDLKHLADGAEPYQLAKPKAGQEPDQQKNSTTSKASKPQLAAPSSGQPAASGMELQHHELLNKIAEVLVGASLQNVKLDPFVVKRLLSDVEMQLNGLRNNSYASGFAAGRLSVQAAASSRCS